MSEEIVITPVSGKHAIVVMAFGLEFDRQLDSKLIDQISKYYEQADDLKAMLPTIEKLNGASITVNGNSQSVSFGNNGLRLLKKHENNKPFWTLEVRGNVLSCSCFCYEKWVAARDFALESILPVCKSIMAEGISIQAIGLQYQDEFRVNTIDLVRGTNELFRKHDNNIWLNERVLSECHPWHIHQGWFADGLGNRRTHNLLNIDAIVEYSSDRCLFRITGQHRLLNKNMIGSEEITLSADNIEQAWENLHKTNKDILLSLISESVSELIGLSDNPTK